VIVRLVALVIIIGLFEFLTKTLQFLLVKVVIQLMVAINQGKTAYNMRVAVRSGRQLISSYDSSGVPALTHGGLTIKPLLLKFIKSRSPATSATRGTLGEMPSEYYLIRRY
jgi:hypothetical protein